MKYRPDLLLLSANLCRGTFARQMPNCRASAKCDDLTRVHNVLRIAGALDRAHDRKRSRAVFGYQILHFPLPDPMLAGAGPVHRKRALDQPLRESFGAPYLVGVVHIDKKRQMKIAVANVGDDRRKDPTFRLEEETSELQSLRALLCRLMLD